MSSMLCTVRAQGCDDELRCKGCLKHLLFIGNIDKGRSWQRRQCQGQWLSLRGRYCGESQKIAMETDRQVQAEGEKRHRLGACRIEPKDVSVAHLDLASGCDHTTTNCERSANRYSHHSSLINSWTALSAETMYTAPICISCPRVILSDRLIVPSL